MEIREFLKLLNQKKQTVLSILFFFILLMAILIAFQSFRYEAKSRVILLQYGGAAIDPYNASKSSQYISGLLSRVVSSGSFLNDVFDSGFNIDREYFGSDQNKKIKKWQKTAEARAIDDTGIIEINTYHTDRNQAEQLNNAIINIIKTKNSLYYGRNEDISIKVIDEPIVSKWPIRPNILLNLGLTIFVALLAAFFYISLFPEEKYNLSVLPKKKENIVSAEKSGFSDKLADEVINEITATVKSDNFSERGDMKNIFDQSNTK